MGEGRWFLKATFHIEGEDGIGDYAEFDEKVKIEIAAAENPEEALVKAKAIIAQITEAIQEEDRESLKIYCDMIDEEAGIVFSDAFLCYEKDLEVSPLVIVAGP